MRHGAGPFRSLCTRGRLGRKALRDTILKPHLPFGGQALGTVRGDPRHEVVMLTIQAGQDLRKPLAAGGVQRAVMQLDRTVAHQVFRGAVRPLGQACLHVGGGADALERRELVENPLDQFGLPTIGHLGQAFLDRILLGPCTDLAQELVALATFDVRQGFTWPLHLGAAFRFLRRGRARGRAVGCRRPRPRLHGR
ncbi:hypothetical protein D3C87_1411600 [compost metagenome]